ISPSYLAPWYFEQKLLETFKNKIKIVSVKKQKVLMPFSGVKVEDIDFDMLHDVDVIQSAALILRKHILALERQKLPANIKTKHLIDGECPEIPKTLIDFYTTLL